MLTWLIPLVRMPPFIPPGEAARDGHPVDRFPIHSWKAQGAFCGDSFEEGSMQLRSSSAVLATVLVALGVSAPTASAAREPLNAYRVAPTQENKQRLVKAGYDMVEADHGSYLEIYSTARQATALGKDGLAPKLQGKANTVASQAA